MEHGVHFLFDFFSARSGTQRGKCMVGSKQRIVDFIIFGF